MRGAPSQWTTGSEWIAVGGLYPAMGETIGLAGTSPERADGGMYDNGGAVGDPPFDPYAMESYDGSMGAAAPGGSGYPSGGGGGGGGGSSDAGDLAGHVFMGLLVVGGITLLVYWGHHRFNVGDSDKFQSIKGTAGDLVLIGFGAWAIVPAIKAGVTWAADTTDWGWLQAADTYGSAA